MLNEIRAYFDNKLEQFGPTPRGVDWNSPEAQEKRFSILSRAVDGLESHSSVLDYGCGYGAMLPFLRARGWQGEYIGFDISERMLAEAERMFGVDSKCRFIGSEPPKCDIVIASGVFNMKQEADDITWGLYVQKSLVEMGHLANNCLVFNMLTSYSDLEKKRRDLYYADPGFWFAFCKQHISSYVALFHDYPLWEFTLLIRKNAGRTI